MEMIIIVLILIQFSLCAFTWFMGRAQRLSYSNIDVRFRRLEFNENAIFYALNEKSSKFMFINKAYMVSGAYLKEHGFSSAACKEVDMNATAYLEVLDEHAIVLDIPSGKRFTTNAY